MRNDIRGMQKGCFIQANIDKGRLHTGQYPAHTPFIDIADDTAFSLALNMNFLKYPASNISHACFRRSHVD